MNAFASLRRAVPQPWKRQVRRWLAGGGHPAAPQVRRIGCVLDLYYWVADVETDTLLPLANYFSVYHPDVDTTTVARLRLLDAAGRELGRKQVAVPHLGAPLLRVSALRAEFGAAAPFGNLVWHLAVPPAIAAIYAGAAEPMLFWDRSYIGYAGADEQVAFVHGVDKALVVNESGRESDWRIGADDSFTAAPEIPVLARVGERTEFVIQNRARRPRRVAMTVRDHGGHSRERAAEIAPHGVQRFPLEAAALAGLDLDAPLALRFAGLPTRYGRPIVFRRFADGALSAMHC